MVTISPLSIRKTGLILLATLLTVGTTGAVSWNTPSGNTNYKDGITLNVTNDNSAENITFQIDGPNSQTTTKTGQLGNNFVTLDFSAGTGNYGSYDLTVNTSKDNSASVNNVVLDGDEPTLDSKSPAEYTTTQDPTVEVTVSDPTTSVNQTILNVSESDGDEVDGTFGTSLSLSDLSEADYDVEYSILDDVGNWNNGSWTFTVDTSYDGDTSPSLSWSESPSDGIIQMDDDIDLTAEFNDDDEEPAELTCYDGDTDESDNEIDSDSGADQNDGNYELSCEIDEDDYEDSTVDLNLKFCDEAGNCETSEEGEYTFDASPPSLMDLSMEVSKVNGGFPVTFSVSDASGVTELNYFFDNEGVDTGNGEETNITESTEEADIDVSGLEAGEHTLYVEVKDNAGRWSDAEAVDFEYLPNAEPTVSISPPDSFSVTAGESNSFDVTVENTGELLISTLEVEFSSDVSSDTSSATDLAPGDSDSLTFSVSTKEEDMGSYSGTVSAGNFSSASFNMEIKANEEQRSSLEEKLSNYKSKLESLKSNFTGLKEDGLSEERRQKLQSRIDTFEQKVESAESAKSNDKYYEVSSSLQNVESDYQTASQTYSEVEEQHQIAERNKIIMIFFGLIVLAGGGIGAYIYQSEEHELNLDKLVDSDFDLSSLEGVKSRIKTAFSNAESEAEEFEWDGFKD